MIKRIIVAVALLLASFLFAFIGVWIAPYAVGLFHSNITYNIVLACIISIVLIITIVLLCKKKWRIYSLLFIPHIIALGLVMFYVGNNISYMGHGFVCVKRKPYSNLQQIRTVSGRVIIDNEYDNDIHAEKISGTKFLIKGLGDWYEIYDADGNCILVKSKDDEEIGSFNRGFYTQKGIEREGKNIYRYRFFDVYGNYIFTRIYDSWHSFGRYSSIDDKEYIKEYKEDVDELPNGIKRFKDGQNVSKATLESQSNNESLAAVERTTSSNSAQVSEQEECSRCHGIGRHKKVVCPTCHGVGEVNDYNHHDPNSFAPPPTTTCKQCNGRRLIDCPLSLNDSHYSNPFRTSPQNVDYNRYSQYNYEVAPVQIDRTKDPCGACHGTGKCTSCGGLGMTYNNMTEKYYKCDVCHQSGVCVGCNGRRYL